MKFKFSAPTKLRLYDVDTCFVRARQVDPKGRHQVGVMLPKGSEEEAAVRKLIENAFVIALEKGKIKKLDPSKLEQTYGQNYPLKDGNIISERAKQRAEENPDEAKDYSNLEGFSIITPTTAVDKPLLVYNRAALPIPSEELMSGCRVNIEMEAYFYEFKDPSTNIVKKGVKIKVVAVQKLTESPYLKDNIPVFSPVDSDESEFKIIS